MNPSLDSFVEDVETETRENNIQDTMRYKRSLIEDKSCRGRVRQLWYWLVMLIFKLQEFAIIFVTVLTTAGVSLASSVATGDAHLAMFYAVFWGALVGFLFLLCKMCIRARRGKAWVDVEVDSSNLVLLLLIVVAMIVCILSLIQLDKHCTDKSSPCNLQKVFTFND